MKSKKILRLLCAALLGTAITSVTPINACAAWKQNSTGWWYDQGSSWATGWKSIDGKWYYFDQSGYMKTGWLNDNGTWYYLSQSGEMKTGWLQNNNTWYYLGDNGAMKTGWLQNGPTWYYLDSNGAMQTGWLKVNNKSYYLTSNGSMQTGWLKYDGGWYFFNESGTMQTGWLEDHHLWYYFSDTGRMKYGTWIEENGNKYYLTEDGSMAHGDTTIDGKEYYFNWSDGKMMTGWVDDIGAVLEGVFKSYYDEDGVLKTGWFDVEGDKYYADKYFVYTGIKKVDNKLYAFKDTGELYKKAGIVGSGKVIGYANEDGTAVTGWKTVNGKTYHFKDNGYANRGLVEIDGSQYYFDCNTCELACNADYYGITTNEKGQVVKINDAKAIEDIRINDSAKLNEIEKEYGKMKFTYAGLYNMDESVDKYSELNIYKKEDKNDKSIMNEQVLLIEGEAVGAEGSVFRVNYHVSIKDGKIYKNYEVFGGNDILYQIKDNKVVQEYVVYQYPV